MKRLTLSVCGLILAGCGGGGSPTTSQPVASTPAPTITASFSKPTANVGTPVALTWSSTNAISCTASGAWSGAQLLSGSLTVTPTVGGQGKYTLTCSGTGGSAVKEVTLVAPIPVQKTSYENKNLPEIVDVSMPNSWILGLETPTASFLFNRPFAIADFTQEGKFSVMAFQAQHTVAAQKIAGLVDAPSKAYFFQRNASGKYIDITEKLIPNPADRLTCITPSYAIVADFNQDGKPDIFVACTGLDFQIDGVWPDARTPQYAYISQVDGTYKRWKSDFRVYAHSCSAGDITGDGLIDVVCVNTGSTPFTLVGDGKGGFTRDDTRFPDLTNKAVGAIELVDTTGSGKLDVFIGGVTPNADLWPSAWYNNVLIKNNGSGFFNVNAPIVLPTSLAPKMVAQGKNLTYSAFHDVLVRDGYAYLLQYDYLYTSTVIRKVNLSNVSDQSIIFENLGNFTGYQQTIPLMKPTKDGYIISISTCQFDTADSNYVNSVCGVKVKM